MFCNHHCHLIEGRAHVLHWQQSHFDRDDMHNCAKSCFVMKLSPLLLSLLSLRLLFLFMCMLMRMFMHLARLWQILLKIHILDLVAMKRDFCFSWPLKEDRCILRVKCFPHVAWWPSHSFCGMRCERIKIARHSTFIMSN